jgi:pimeloyl-ACP methyl ester carboxylesterase
MHLYVNGIRLYFDVEGSALVPDGRHMRQRPTLILLHGGPGADHSGYKPYFSTFADQAQVIYLDHRGNGRSEHGSAEHWNIAQWADDLHCFCQALSIERPIVYGASFGGIIAMAYATRYPTHPSKLILVSTAAKAGIHAAERVAMFEKLGGPGVGRLAYLRFVEGNTSPEVLKAWLEFALPYYSTRMPDPLARAREISNPAATAWFNKADGEGRKFDLLTELHKIQCPVLLMGGKLDPMTPIECQRQIAAGISPDLLEYHEFEDCGHGVVNDKPDEAGLILKAFIHRVSPQHRASEA